MKSITSLALIVASVMPACNSAQASSNSPKDEITKIKEVISQYHSGFIENDPATVLSTLGKEFIMFNGNYSGDPALWQAHLFLTGDDLQRWPAEFLKQAGPYQNQHEFLRTHIRGNAAVVVTQETGKNKFRAWENEKVTWLLGRRNNEWKIVGFFIRDIRNPE